MPLVILCGCGLLYCVLSLAANALIWHAKRNIDQPDVALPVFHLAADLFPLHMSFRDAPAVYSVYAQAHGWMKLDEALTEVRNALRFHPNLSYLRAHEARLQGMKP